MASPIQTFPPASPAAAIPGETPEQRRARLQAYMKANPVQMPFSPQQALNDFGNYFMGLRKQYSDQDLARAGITGDYYQSVRNSLNSIMADPRATVEQQKAALRDAMAGFAQKLTTPQPIREVRPVEMPPMPTQVTPTQVMPAPAPLPPVPTFSHGGPVYRY